MAARETVSRTPVTTKSHPRWALRNARPGSAVAALATAPPSPNAPRTAGSVQHVVAPKALSSALAKLVRATHFVPSKVYSASSDNFPVLMPRTSSFHSLRERDVRFGASPIVTWPSSYTSTAGHSEHCGQRE